MSARTAMEAGRRAGLHPVVHLELHTPDIGAASSFYSRLLGWEPQRIDTCAGSYHALDLSAEVGGGIVQCSTTTGVWLPYVEVNSVARLTDEARRLGASVPLEPREGPFGWRSVVRTPDGGELALWQPRDPR